MNPDLCDCVEIGESIGCDIGTDPEDEVIIEPGETYEVLFKLNVDSVNLANSVLEEEETKKEQ